MRLKSLKPSNCLAAYIRAAEIFQNMYFQVTGSTLELTDTDDGVSDLVVIGSDAVNGWVLDNMFNGNIPPRLGLVFGTDSYCIKSFTVDGRKILLLAGGRGRSTIYAVYDYFERYAGCHYFWDGDCIPHMDSLPMENICVNEEPHFRYRGLRYFAHRGLKRFQAEHWSLEDWKREIDWMMKKRLNFFMLRIGMDDVWQRAFPEAVSYPDGFTKITEYDHYDDRSDFWTPEYRGKLRESILEYARMLDLDYPTDCGTMTHWYSRTPQEFIDKVNPAFVTDNSYGKSDKTGMVMDFRRPENMDRYMKLTKTMVETMEKRSDLFHSIGLGERKLFPEEPKKDFYMKLFAYRLITENLRREYPNSMLMLASWDFIYRWDPEDVKALLNELDPERTLILDYTSDICDPEQSFLNWGLVNKFPWIFGFLHAYESENDLMGNYARCDERLKVAAEDPYCKGMIFWPELSHSDALILEYLSANAWSPLEKNIQQLIQDFCRNRYGRLANQMNDCWQQMLPLIETRDWSNIARTQYWIKDTTNCAKGLVADDAAYRSFYESNRIEFLPILENAVCAVEGLARLESFDDEFILRDTIDLTRTAIGPMLNMLFGKAVLERDSIDLSGIEKVYLGLWHNLAELLSLNNDFSMYHTLQELKKTAPTNPDFEITLKHNICNSYCKQAAYELIVGLKLQEAEDVFNWLKTPDRKLDDLKNTQCYNEVFYHTSLADLQPAYIPDTRQVMEQCAALLRDALNILK